MDSFTIIKARGPLVNPFGRNFQSKKGPDRTTCAYGRDTYREIQHRECASRFTASARFCAEFCPQGNIRGKEFLPRGCAQKWVPPKSVSKDTLLIVLRGDLGLQGEVVHLAHRGQGQLVDELIAHRQHILGQLVGEIGRAHV